MRRARVHICLTVVVAAISMVVAGQVSSRVVPARASVLPVPHASPPQGYTTLDRHGCPIYHEPTSGTRVAAFGNGGPTTTFLKRGERCVPLPVSVFTLSNPAGGRCTQLLIVQVADPKGLSNIAAVVYSTIGEGTRWWENPVNGITGTGSGTAGGGSTGFGDVSYKVPKGDYAWQVGGGSSPDPCGAPVPLDGWGAWGITAKYAISGVVTLGCDASCPDNGLPVADVSVSADGPTKATATTDDGGMYFVLVSKGSYRVTPRIPGWSFEPGRRLVDVKSSSISHVDFRACGPGARGASASPMTVTWKFTGSECQSTVNVTYTPPPSGGVGDMTVGWKAYALACDTGWGRRTIVPVDVTLIKDGTPVPKDLVEANKGLITAHFSSAAGVLEMDIDLHADGAGGEAALYNAAFHIRPAHGADSGQLCKPGSGVVMLHRTR